MSVEISQETFAAVTQKVDGDFQLMLGGIRIFLHNGYYDYLNFWRTIGIFVRAYRQIPIYEEKLRGIDIVEGLPVSKDDARRIWNFLADAPLGGSSHEPMLAYIEFLESSLLISVERSDSLFLLSSCGFVDHRIQRFFAKPCAKSPKDCGNHWKVFLEQPRAKMDSSLALLLEMGVQMVCENSTDLWKSRDRTVELELK